MLYIGNSVLPKPYRLRKSSQFKRVYEKARRFSCPSIVLLVLKNEVSEPRVGISVSTKVGKAVVRNRLKRLVREAFREFLPKIVPVDIVVVLRTEAVGSSFVSIKSELNNLLTKAGVLYGDSGRGDL